MNLLDVPSEDLIEERILPLLQVNDILRLRRVCKALKNSADNYLWLNGHERLGRIEISAEEEDERSFRNFLNLGFSVSNVSLRTPGPDALGSEKAVEFIVKLGEKIKDLKVDNLFCLIAPVELQFYEKLSNLKSLEVDRLHLTESWTRCCYPKSLKNLKKLEIHVVIIPTDEEDRVDYVSKLFEYCDKATYFKLPLYKHIPSNTEILNVHLMNLVAHIVYGTFQENREGEEPSLEYFDISSFKSELKSPFSTLYFQEFFRSLSVSKKKLKLLLVDAGFVQDVDLEIWKSVAPQVLSVRNYGLHMFSGDTQAVEAIEAETRKCEVPFAENTENNRWPNLKRLSVRVDSFKYLSETHPLGLLNPKIQKLYKTFFKSSTSRENLLELDLNFAEKEADSEKDYECPGASSFTENYPNLKVFKLTNWPGTNKVLSLIWKGLSNLEEISLDGCKGMGNVAFVGEDKDDPVFLQLKKLKKLELRNIDSMPKITDTLFSLVLRHMKLTHLILHSANPIQNVSAAGIRALLTGDFANSIEKFPFDGWSISFKPEEGSMAELANQFRSSHMI